MCRYTTGGATESAVKKKRDIAAEVLEYFYRETGETPRPPPERLKQLQKQQQKQQRQQKSQQRRNGSNRKKNAAAAATAVGKKAGTGTKRAGRGAAPGGAGSAPRKQQHAGAAEINDDNATRNQIVARGPSPPQA